MMQNAGNYLVICVGVVCVVLGGILDGNQGFPARQSASFLSFYCARMQRSRVGLERIPVDHRATQSALTE